MTDSALLSLDQVTLGYTSSPVVRRLDLTVRGGEVVALLGPNGAGKSTTLRAISRLIEPMSGVIRFAGDDIGSINREIRYRGQTLDRDIAYNYFPPLRKLAKRRAALLSGGEQQMLGLGRALARRPRLLMVDELSLGLAPVIVQRLLPSVRRFADETGAGVLLIEQHVHMALAIADRGYVLVHGEVVLEGQADRLMRDRQLLTASYMGEAEAEHLGESVPAPRGPEGT